MKALIVTAGLMVAEGKVLLAQRKENAHQGLLWEFPGGKVTEGEEPRQALRRELREELAVEVEVGALFDAVYYSYPEFPVLLLVYRCKIRKGVPQPLASRALQWVDPRELEEIPMPPADRRLQKRLRSLPETS
jgi:mutator protein MutT